MDVIARVVAQGLSEQLGQQMVVDNRAGAAGLIGAELVAKSAPDGYTLLFGFSGPLAIVPNLNDATPYDTLKDFAPVTLAASAPYVLLVHPGVPAKSVKELVALAKSQPAKFSYASGGTGTGIHMAGELFNLSAGVQILHVPYKGAAPAQTALMAGEVSMMFNGLSPALPFVKSGKLRALAVGGTKRTPLLPDVPTVAEYGYDFHTTGWYGVVVARGTPRAIVNKLRGATVKALALPEVKDKLAALAVEGIGSSPEEFSALLREELVKWAKVIKAAGLKGRSS
ncbi:MAG TPA: tripartite tricarboxylate transporter substrate binding protein [Burkholderiales bacterium]|nr:tripartite tricarboxylate transporter substrate binding protein [Burkholderiales bacterium]